jgi:coproporphyrinogen III oxidase
MTVPSRVAAMLAFAERLQEHLCLSLEAMDGEARFDRRRLELAHGGSASPRVLEDGPVLERAAVHVTHSRAHGLPSAATVRRPDLAARGYQAASISVIVHPRNPYAPTAHLNLRYFETTSAGDAPVAWFGGGFDLTPIYGFVEDAVAWHRAARAACLPFGAELYPRWKRQCDEYFLLPHRGEPRGIGGIFFDDLRSLDGGLGEGQDDLDRCFELVQAVGASFVDAYLPILERRRDTPWGDRQRQFQLYRRGRYVEFNLLHDRGTRFGLEAGSWAESLLASLPPLAAWRYDWHAEPGSEEAALAFFLEPRDWASLDPDCALEPRAGLTRTTS